MEQRAGYKGRRKTVKLREKMKDRKGIEWFAVKN